MNLIDLYTLSSHQERMCGRRFVQSSGQAAARVRWSCSRALDGEASGFELNSVLAD
ncbi:MAG: hypothetical protein ACRDWG_02625 [Actinomycetes bacterium]